MDVQILSVNIDGLGQYKRSSDSQDISACLSVGIHSQRQSTCYVGNFPREMWCSDYTERRTKWGNGTKSRGIGFALNDYLASCTFFPIFFPPKYRHLCSYFYRLDKSPKKHLPMRRWLLCSCGPLQGLIPAVSSGTPWTFSNQTSMHFHFEIVSDRYCAIDICICLSIVWA